MHLGFQSHNKRRAMVRQQLSKPIPSFKFVACQCVVSEKNVTQIFNKLKLKRKKQWTSKGIKTSLQPYSESNNTITHSSSLYNVCKI